MGSRIVRALKDFFGLVAATWRFLYWGALYLWLRATAWSALTEGADPVVPGTPDPEAPTTLRSGRSFEWADLLGSESFESAVDAIREQVEGDDVAIVRVQDDGEPIDAVVMCRDDAIAKLRESRANAVARTIETEDCGERSFYLVVTTKTGACLMQWPKLSHRLVNSSGGEA